jgi:hypothetical protein
MTCPAANLLRLELQPVTIREANAFVAKHHRHHKPPQGAKFAIACNDGDNVVGVVIVGRPVARMLDNGYTAEITRLCTDGTPNACSMLYGAAWRAARAMGYRRLITYILATENGASLKASNYRLIGEAGGGNWNKTSRPRVDTAKELQGQKLLWEIV